MIPHVTLALIGINEQTGDGEEHRDGRCVVIATRNVGRKAACDNAGSRGQHVNARNERDDPENRVDDLGPGKRQQPDEEHGDKPDHAIEDDLVQQRCMADELGRCLGLSTHGIDMRGDDDLLAATGVVGHARGHVLCHDVLRDAACAHLGENGIIVILGEVDEEAGAHEDETDDEHAERDAGHENANAGNDRTKGRRNIRENVGPAHA